jgi:hypothetical protein
MRRKCEDIRNLGLSGRIKTPIKSEIVTGIAAIKVRKCQLLRGRMIHARPEIRTDPPVQKYPIKDKNCPLTRVGINSANKSNGMTTPPIPIPQSVRNKTRKIKFDENALATPATMIIEQATLRML